MICTQAWTTKSLASGALRLCAFKKDAMLPPAQTSAPLWVLRLPASHSMHIMTRRDAYSPPRLSSWFCSQHLTLGQFTSSRELNFWGSTILASCGGQVLLERIVKEVLPICNTISCTSHESINVGAVWNLKKNDENMMEGEWTGDSRRWRSTNYICQALFAQHVP